MSDPSLFLGRFHPLIVHFPIALLLLAALLRALVWRRAGRTAGGGAALEPAAGLVLWLGAAGAVAAAGAGLLLGSSGAYGGPTYDRHQWLGLSVAATSLVAALMWSLRERGAGWMRVQAAVLAAAVVLVVAAGHFGATLTHGEGFLTEHAPPFLRDLVQGPPPAAAPHADPGSLVVFDTFVAPALDAHCVDCHGPARAEGALRLDTLAGIRKGGDDGAVISAGRADASEIVRRVWLPPSHPDAMPPRGRRPLSPADALLLRWWVDQGAAGDLTVAQAEISDEVAPVIEAIAGPLVRGGPAVPAVPVPEADAGAVAAAVAAGFVVAPVSDGTPFLHVHATNAGGRIDDEAVGRLAGIAPQVLWLDLGGTRVTDAGLAVVGRLPQLTRLHLQQTAVGDAGLVHLAGLPHLEYLNLYGSRVTDAGLEHLAGLTSLRSLYLWQTGVTERGVARLTAALPRLVVDLGS